jgi:DNA-binding beta-propeller fold protein YncE
MRTLLAVLALAIALPLHADLLVVANRGGSTVTLVDPATMQRVGQVDAGPQPHEVAISADNKFAYVSNYVNGTGTTISVIDLVSRTKARTISIAPLAGPHGIVQRGGKIWFTAEAAQSVARYDPVTDRIDWIGRTNQAGTHMLAVGSTGNTVYTANVISRTASIIDVQGNESVARKSVPLTMTHSEGIALSPSEHELWIGSAQTGGIAIIDLLTESVVSTLSPGSFAYRITFTHDGRTVLVPRFNEAAITVYDAVARLQTRVVPIEGKPLSIIVSPDSKFAYIATVQPERVIKLDLTTWETVGSVEASPVPDGLAYARDPFPPPAHRRRSTRS